MESITHLLYQKGYRQHFTIRVPGSGRPVRSGNISSCLQYFFESKDTGPSRIELATTAPYAFHIKCRFYLGYEDKDGFSITRLFVENIRARDNREFQFRHNQEIPGAMSLEGLFPKPKPWEQIWKGKWFKR